VERYQISMLRCLKVFVAGNSGEEILASLAR
jgi:hypothetical protein